MKATGPILGAAALVAGCTAARDRAGAPDPALSPQVIAFQAADARLAWQGARIEYDADGCAVYHGVAPGGLERREPLAGPDGAPICPR